MAHDYPLLKKCYPDWEAKALELFSNLKSINYRERIVEAEVIPRLVGVRCKDIRPGFRTKNGIKNYIIAHKPSDFWDCNTISDLFTEEVRIECNKHGHDSPLVFWQKNRAAIIREVGNNFATEYDKLLTQRETAYMKNGEGRKECTIHRPIVTYSLIKYFGAKRILDPCAGWGGRMIASLATDCALYVGVDPNEKLHPHYADIQRVLGGTAQLFCCPFEEFVWDGAEFDFAYTSPPYFNLEIYGDAATQSISKFKGEKKWVQGFLLPLLEKCIQYVKNGGIIAINICETNSSNYMCKMLEYMKRRGQHYLGTMGFVGQNPAFAMPILIWRVNKQQRVA